jgi:hypothetical protein
LWTPDDGAVAAGHGVDPVGWRELFDELMFLVAGRFTRVEPFPGTAACEGER